MPSNRLLAKIFSLGRLCAKTFSLGRLCARVFAIGILCSLLGLSTLSQDAAWQRDLLAWRAQHVADLLKPDGWLSLAGLEWLQPGDNPFGSAPDNKIRLPAGNPPAGNPAHLGVLHLQGTIVTLSAPSGGFPAGFLIDGKPAQAQELRTDPDNDAHNPRLTIGTLNMYVIRRGARFALRIKDSKSPTLTGFHGLHWYDPNSQYRVTAKWLPYEPPKTVTLATLIGTTYDQPVPGAAEFTLSAKTYRLEPVLEDPAGPKLFFVLRDTTSATTTYAACRFLYTGLPSNGLGKPGELVLDFNHVENPPCAYTPFATCPLPPRGNRLPIPLPVGEKRYHD
jgi:uncharacterized protein (DUF1684 family)